jgi:hypothetical protein
MAAPYNPPKRGEDFIFYVALNDMATPGSFKAAPTLAAGDFKISKDGGAFANLNTLPDVDPDTGVAVKITLSATEMTADNVMVVAIDQTATKEWADAAWNIVTTQ